MLAIGCELIEIESLLASPRRAANANVPQGLLSAGRQVLFLLFFLFRLVLFGTLFRKSKTQDGPRPDCLRGRRGQWRGASGERGRAAEEPAVSVQFNNGLQTQS